MRELSAMKMCNTHDLYVDFDIAMGKGSGYYRQLQKYSYESQLLYQFFRDLYIKNSFVEVQAETEPRIPKIIHQMWIGRRPLPSKMKPRVRSWKATHPTWEYRFWGNEEIKNYKFILPELEELFSRPLTMGERVDILRYDILYQYGGIYADVDELCLKNFDPFVHRYDFFGGLFPPFLASFEKPIFLQNCLFGVKAGHPIIKELAAIVYRSWEANAQTKDEYQNTHNRTGFTLTDAVAAKASHDGNIDIVMPAGYFLPVYQRKTWDFLTRGPFEIIMGLFDHSRSPFSRIKPYSFAHHTAENEWAADLYESVDICEMWLDFKLKNWASYFRSKLLPKSSRPKLRQTFQELLEDVGSLA